VETLVVADRGGRHVRTDGGLRVAASRWSAWALLAAGLLFAFSSAPNLFGMEGYASDLETARGDDPRERGPVPRDQ